MKKIEITDELVIDTESEESVIIEEKK
jgi:hypothetical protein